MPKLELRQRQVHLDFHTGPAVPTVGDRFNSREFARTFKRAHVNSVTVFAKCHHGHLYYNTKRPERHPHLKKGYDLLRRQVDALHRAEIRAPIYISVLCDEYAADHHPDWLALNADNTLPRRPADVFQPGWQILDMSSPYQDYLAEQTEEILKKFKPVDGIFFDMCWDQPSSSKWAIAGMRRMGLKPDSEKHRQVYAAHVSQSYMKRFSDLVRKYSPAATVYFNGRPLSGLSADLHWMTQVEIEALPTGGWGYLYFPKNVRYARTFGKPYLGMTARFHKSWGDFGSLKPPAALKYEITQMLANGAECSIGDQLHPGGQLDAAVYDLIGEVYGYAEQCEPWTSGASPVTQVGVVRSDTGGDHKDAPAGAHDGVTRMFNQLKYQFDFIDSTGKLEKYDLLVLPDQSRLDPVLVRRLRAYTQAGGKLLVVYRPGAETVSPRGVGTLTGVRILGDSPYTSTYLRFGNEINTDVPATDHVIYERGVRVRRGPGTQVLARVVEPYFERAWDQFCSHGQTPNQLQASRYPAAVRKGNVVTILYPIFKAYATHGNLVYRQLVKNCIDLLLPQKLVAVTGPSTMEVTVMRQKQRTVVHLLNFVTERRTATLDVVEDIVPLHNVPVQLQVSKKPKRVYLAPGEQDLEFRYADSLLETTIPVIDGHAMLVVD